MATEGEYGMPGALGGFGLGIWSYGGYLAGGGSHSWGNFGRTIAISTATGFALRPVGLGRYYFASRYAAGGMGLVTARW